MPRILLADDDASLLQLSAELLGPYAEVDATPETKQALQWIFERRYDLLITDLNIERASDGLLLAAAVRALHPETRTVLITGYPDFTGAIAAMQSTLDRVLIKPVDFKELINLPQALPERSTRQPTGGNATIWQVITREQERILEAWLTLIEADPYLRAISMNREERLDHMTNLVQSLCKPESGTEQERESAKHHGLQRREHGYHPEWISIEMSYMRRVIFEAILRELLELDLSRFAQDLFTLNLRLDVDLLASLRAFGLGTH
jgi:YesN/AraC family two-component response regulator